MTELDKEKVLAIYDESRRIVNNGLRSGKTRTELVNEIYKIVKEIVDDED